MKGRARWWRRGRQWCCAGGRGGGCARTGPADGGGARRRAADGDAEVRGDPDTWGPPAREGDEGERESRAGPTAGPGRGGRGDFPFFLL